MRGYIFVILFLLACSIASASLNVNGKVQITIKNDPPEIATIFFTNDEVYADSTVSCDATVIDEFPENVNLKYSWTVNDVPINFNGKALSPDFFKAGDVIQCTITPNDRVKDGSPKSVSVTVKPIQVTIKVAQTVLSVAGVTANAEQIGLVRKEKGTIGVTGLVVTEFGNKPQDVAGPVLIFLMSIILLFSANLLIRSILRKHKNLEQDLKRA